MAGETGQAAKKALTEWYGHRDFCWACATPDGDRCDIGARLHDLFMAACRAELTPAQVRHLDEAVPLW